MPAAATRPNPGPGLQPPEADESRRRPRPVFVPLAVVIIVLLLAELAVRVGKSALSTPSAWPAPELQKKYDQIVARSASPRGTDVVLAGDSMMDAAGDPQGLDGGGTNLAIYNASIAGETLPTVVEWTTKVAVPRLHPKVVVVGFSSNELNPAQLSPALGLGAYRHSRAVRAAEGTGSLLDRADALLRRWSLLYRYRTVLRHPFASSPSKAAQAVFDPALTTGGRDLAFADQRYLAAGGPAQARLVLEGVSAALKGFTVGPQNVAILSGMFTSLRRQGIQVLFVVMPVTADLVSLHPAGAADYQRALDSFTSIANSSGITMLVPGVWPTTEFADPVHLNASGTARFSDYLRPFLLQAVGTGNAG